MLENALSRRGASRGRDPFYELANRFFNGAVPGFVSDTEDSSTGWLPSVDIRENEHAFVVAAELPGLKKDDIDVAIEDNLLTISGERKLEKETENDNYHRVERRYGSFRRSFSLPRIVDAGKVEAKFADGVLHLTLPKAETAKARKIAVG